MLALALITHQVNWCVIDVPSFFSFPLPFSVIIKLVEVIEWVRIVLREVNPLSNITIIKGKKKKKKKTLYLIR